MKKIIIIAITSILISLVSQAGNYNDAQLVAVDQYRAEVKVLNTQHVQEVNAIKDALRAEGLYYEALVGTPETRALIAAHKEKLQALKAEVIEQLALLD